jgi:hypothetical protein
MFIAPAAVLFPRSVGAQLRKRSAPTERGHEETAAINISPLRGEKQDY